MIAEQFVQCLYGHKTACESLKCNKSITNLNRL